MELGKDKIKTPAAQAPKGPADLKVLTDGIFIVSNKILLNSSNKYNTEHKKFQIQ